MFNFKRENEYCEKPCLRCYYFAIGTCLATNTKVTNFSTCDGWIHWRNVNFILMENYKKENTYSIFLFNKEREQTFKTKIEAFQWEIKQRINS
jgi:hypothetical protein